MTAIFATTTRQDAPAPGSRATRALAVAAITVLALAGCAESGAQESVSFAENASSRNLQASDLEGRAGVRFTSAYGDYLAGQFANRERDLEAAAGYMARALRDDPQNPALIQQTFQLMASDGQIEAARELAERMLTLGSEQPPALLVLAVDEIRAGNLDTAQEYAERLPERGLAGVVRPLLMSWLIAERNGPEAAIEAIEALSAEDGFGALRAMHTALILDHAGESEAAREAYEQARALAGGLSMRMAWLAGNFHERQGEWDEAAALYQRFLADSPENPTGEALLERAREREKPAPVVASVADGVSEGLFNLAGMLSQQRSAGEISLIYTQLSLHLKPEFDIARVLLGELLQQDGRNREAVAAYRQVDPESALYDSARQRYAEGLQALERREEAAEILEALAEAAPHRHEPLVSLGNLYREQERYEDAEAAYARALERVETVEHRHWTLLYFHAITLERLDRWDEAEARFKAALELEPEQPHVMNYLAYSWVERDTNLEQAESMLIRAVELRPEDGYIVDSLGWVYYGLGEYDKAVTHLERAVELRPHDPVINDHLGDAYWKVGRKHEARFQWLRAQRLDPEDDALAEIKVKLEGGLEALAAPNG